MLKLNLTVAAVAAILATGSMTKHAEAMTLGAQAGIRAAIEDLTVTDMVHCVPGVWHHRFRPRDGCIFIRDRDRDRDRDRFRDRDRDRDRFRGRDRDRDRRDRGRDRR